MFICIFVATFEFVLALQCENDRLASGFHIDDLKYYLYHTVLSYDSFFFILIEKFFVL
jgi:hypothetical protein